MRLLLLTLFVVSTGSAVVRAQEAATERVHLSRPAERTAVIAVVTAQLAAFRAEKWEDAYGFAAPSFQNMMPLEAFERLITRNYMVVWKNTRAEFGVPSDNGSLAVVPVRVFGNGTSEAYNWLLAKGAEGWRVTGVVPQRTSDGA